MKARLRVLPFDNTWAEHEITEICTVTELLQKLDADDEFYTNGKILLNDHEIYKDKWGKIKVRPEAPGFLDICLIPNGKSTLILIASVALAVAVTAISGGLLGPAGLGLLGSSFAAGGLGASLAAAGVGLVGAYALGQLTALPPSAQEAQTQTKLSTAGISGNALRPDELLPVIFGKIGYSPPQIMPAYTTFRNNALTINAVVGVEGRCLIEDIKIDGTDIASIEGLVYETREGALGEAPLTLAPLTCIQEPSGKLSQHETEVLTNKIDQLKNQADPDDSLPVYHYFNTRGTANEIWLRLLFPSGMVYTADTIYTSLLLRIEIREKGSPTWRNLPTFHFWDENKGVGQIRQEIKIKIGRPANGPLRGSAPGEYALVGARDVQGNSTWEYEADPYFNRGANPADEVPVMTSGTTSGVTITDTQNAGAGFEGWRACDSNATTSYWGITTANLPQSMTVDFGVGNTKRIKSYLIGGGAASNAPNVRAGFLSGSNNNVDFTLLSTFDETEFIPQNITGFVQIPADYRYYKLTVTRANGFSQTRLTDFQLWEDDGYSGNLAGGDAQVHYVSIDEDGCEIYLDPDQGWNVAEYEVRVKRSSAINASQYYFDASGADNYGGAGGGVNLTNFFGYTLSGTTKIVQVPQRYFRSDLHMEIFSTVSYDSPVDTTGIACIAIEAKGLTIQSVYAIWTSYGNEFDGNVWEEIQVPTRRPAALYRNVLLGYGNADPAPGEVLEQDVFEDWFSNNVAADHECNMVVSGQVIRDVLQIIATAGMAAPRNSNELGIVEDLDTSAEPPRNPLTAANSRSLGTQIVLPNLPHGVRIEFFNQDDDYSIDNTVTIYRDGYNSENAKLFETRRYPGWTDIDKVSARALFDIRQLLWRAKRYIREVGLEGLNFKKGQLSAINDDALEETHAAGWIKSWQTSGPNVVSITLTHIMPWGHAQQDVTQVDDVLALTDVLDQDVPMGIFYRDADGNEHLHQVSNVTDSNVATFVTPFLEAGSGLEVDLMVGAGRWGNVRRRVKVMAKVPKSMDKWVIELADEAPQLFLP